jgi:hypothetical protein
MPIRFPWDNAPGDHPHWGSEAPAAAAHPLPKPRGRRRGAERTTPSSPRWLYHRLTIGGLPEAVAAFTQAARGPGIIPWRLDFDRIEEDVFHLAAAQPPERRNLTIAGCRILARQFRERMEDRQARAAALIGTSKACPFDLQALLPVPPGVLMLGPTHPDAVAWLAANWGLKDGPRQVAVLEAPVVGQRLPAGHVAMGYGFFTADSSPRAAIAALGRRLPALRFVLQPRPPT